LQSDKLLPIPSNSKSCKSIQLQLSSILKVLSHTRVCSCVSSDATQCRHVLYSWVLAYSMLYAGRVASSKSTSATKKQPNTAHLALLESVQNSLHTHVQEIILNCTQTQCQPPTHHTVKLERRSEFANLFRKQIKNSFHCVHQMATTISGIVKKCSGILDPRTVFELLALMLCTYSATWRSPVACDI